MAPALSKASNTDIKSPGAKPTWFTDLTKSYTSKILLDHTDFTISR